MSPLPTGAAGATALAEVDASALPTVLSPTTVTAFATTSTGATTSAAVLLRRVRSLLRT